MINVKNILIIVICILILCGGVYGIKYFMDIKQYKEAIKEIKIAYVDLSRIKDGNYPGEFETSFIGAEVNVKVEKHKIVDIELVKHKNERGKKAEIIPEEVVQAQSLQVDTVSGATNSSKVILKAIENALESADKIKQ
ncbi:FMN-binding protein [Clostridium sp. YIM B02555]|uniref:FMN-binding protein n=1 Tax=Clostridium sp. YIM B02555 TaxID=2911968 RepID=UPI001EEF4BE1|nr:FMN-binding protein [Clostridium sp. YIM B02555]